MAVEVQQGCYLFHRRNEKSVQEYPQMTTKDYFRGTMRFTGKKINLSDDQDSVRVFHHNPIHDEESLWWICVEAVFRNQVSINGIVLDQTNFFEQWESVSKLFPHGPARGAFLFDHHYVFMRTLHPQLKGVGNVLSATRKFLVQTYEDAETALDGEMVPFFYSGDQLLPLADLYAEGESMAKGMMLGQFPKEWFLEYVGQQHSLEDTRKGSISLKRKSDDPSERGSKKVSRYA